MIGYYKFYHSGEQRMFQCTIPTNFDYQFHSLSSGGVGITHPTKLYYKVSSRCTNLCSPYFCFAPAFSYRPTLPLTYIVDQLVFSPSSEGDAESLARQFLIALGVKFSDAEQTVINCGQSSPAVAAAVSSGVAAS
uniref:Uncharacterized protein n=1 Tax=Cacopsylla melanoneura TaxID=428564 RepID=A0A8D8LIB0_9HEMI